MKKMMLSLTLVLLTNLAQAMDLKQPCYEVSEKDNAVAFRNPKDAQTLFQFVQKFARQRITKGLEMANQASLVSLPSDNTNQATLIVFEGNEIDGDVGDHSYYNFHRVLVAINPTTCKATSLPLDLGTFKPY